MTSTVYIDIKKSKTLWPKKRAQKFYWVATLEENRKKVGKSYQMFTNEEECVENSDLLFGDQTKVYLRHNGIKGSRVLRSPITGTGIGLSDQEVASPPPYIARRYTDEDD